MVVEIHTLGETRTKETRNLLDQTLGSKEGIVLASKLLDELLVLVQLLQVVGGHAVEAVVLGTVKIVLVTENAIINPSVSRSISNRVTNHIPDGHSRTREGRQTDGARETLVTLRVIVLQTDLKLDGLEEVPLLLILRVVEQLLDILAHSGCITQRESAQG